jgi:glycosyltransferase involved in cell wall biosynthesis
VKVALGIVAGTVGGPRSYGLGLAEALARGFPGDRWIVFTDRPADFDGIPLHEVIRVPLPARVLRPAIEEAVLPRLVRRVAPDLYHGTKHAVPPRTGCPRVATIHDLAFLVLPGTFPRASRAWLRIEARAAARRSRLLVTPSEHTRRDCVRLLGVPGDRVRVVPNGVAPALLRPAPAGEADRVRRAHRLPDRFVLCLGTLQPRKNPGALLEAMARLRASGRAGGVGLVFAGRRGWMSGAFLRDLEARGPALGAVLREGIPDADLPGLLAAAEVFCSPTSYEGFGLSIAEAMAAGLAVVAGEGSSVPEVTGDAAVLVPGADAGALAASLGALLEDPAARAALGARARARAARFTWDAAARGMRAAYEEARLP